MPKNTPRPRPLSGAGRGKGPEAHVFRGPVRPITNSTYGTLAARSAMVSKIRIAVGGSVIDADYTREIQVILRNHAHADSSHKGGDQIAQLIVEKIADANALEVDSLESTERRGRGFGSSDLNPKRSITAKEEERKMFFLYGDTTGNEVFSATDIGCRPCFMREREMLSRAHVSAALTRTINDAFLDKILAAGKEEKSGKHEAVN